MSNNFTQPTAASIVTHYRAKGYRAQELRRVVGRHCRLLGILDPEVAMDLEEAALTDGAKDRENRRRAACVAAWRRRKAR